jgi:pimeloyl-ACP methyl ester carboxylesterase
VFIAGPASVPDVVKRFAAMMGLPRRVEALLYGTVAAKVGRSAEELDLLEMAGGLTIPTLLFHDVDDAEVPYQDALALAAAWPAATLRTVTGLGHRRILRDPAVVAEAVAFVTTGRLAAQTPRKAAIA